MSACLEVPGAGGEHGQLATAPLLLLLALTPPPLDISNAAPHLIGICYYPTDTCSSHYNLSCVISWKWLKRGTNTEFSYRDEQDARYPSVFFFLNPAGHRKRHRETVPTGYRISEKPDIRPNTKQACGKNIFIWKNAISQWFLWRTRKDDYREKLKTSLFYIFWNFFGEVNKKKYTAGYKAGQISGRSLYLYVYL